MKTNKVKSKVNSKGSVLSRIEAWGDERSITTQEHNTANFVKNIVEELGELIEADKNNDTNEMIDAIDDIMVFCITELPKLNVSADDALEETLKEISSRTGAWDEEKGKWVKYKTPEAMDKWYKADYMKLIKVNEEPIKVTLADLFGYVRGVNCDIVNEIVGIEQKAYTYVDVPRKIRKVFDDYAKTPSDDFVGCDKAFTKLDYILSLPIITLEGITAFANTDITALFTSDMLRDESILWGALMTGEKSYIISDNVPKAVKKAYKAYVKVPFGRSAAKELTKLCKVLNA